MTHAELHEAVLRGLGITDPPTDGCRCSESDNVFPVLHATEIDKGVSWTNYCAVCGGEVSLMGVMFTLGDAADSDDEFPTGPIIQGPMGLI